jgi:hypothetical protein
VQYLSIVTLPGADTHPSVSTNDILVDEVKRGCNVSYNAGMKAYNVRGTSGIIRVVTLRPKETCSCPSTGACYHLRAVKETIGMGSSNHKPKVLNLTKLRKNSRPRQRKSGRKRPRPEDVDYRDRSMLTETSDEQGWTVVNSSTEKENGK